MATGDLPGCSIYLYMDDLIVFNNKKFLDYLKETYPSQLTVEKANKLDHLADYLDLTYIIDSGGASFEAKVNNIWFRITRAQHINQEVIQKSSDQLQTLLYSPSDNRHIQKSCELDENLPVCGQLRETSIFQ